MATTTYGSPYVANTDLVSAWPGVSLNVAQRVDAVSYAGNGINAQTGTTYTLVLTDAGKNVTLSNASAVTVTIPASSSVAYATGTVISLTNLGAGTVTVAAAGGVTLNGSTLTIGQYSRSSIMKVATDTWVLTSGGGIPKATVSATTGSPTITTVGSQTCYKFTGTGSITVTAGTCQALVIGGGAGGGSSAFGGGGAGGAGGFGNYTTLYLSDGTQTVTVGGGGAAGSKSPGSDSAIGSFVGVGGGGVGAGGNDSSEPRAKGEKGGSGGGAGYLSSGTYAGGPGVLTQGNSGASVVNGGGGGAGAAATTTAGGAGLASSITGSSVTYSTGGSTTTTAAGAANTGNGASATAGNTAAGGSGVVIILIG